MFFELNLWISKRTIKRYENDFGTSNEHWCSVQKLKLNCAVDSGRQLSEGCGANRGNQRISLNKINNFWILNKRNVFCWTSIELGRKLCVFISAFFWDQTSRWHAHIRGLLRRTEPSTSRVYLMNFCFVLSHTNISGWFGDRVERCALSQNENDELDSIFARNVRREDLISKHWEHPSRPIPPSLGLSTGYGCELEFPLHSPLLVEWERVEQLAS